MLKDTRIPPMQFREKTCVSGHRSFGGKVTEINTPPWGIRRNTKWQI